MPFNDPDSVRAFLHRLSGCDSESCGALIAGALTDGSTWRVADPVNDLVGAQAVLERLVRPLRAAIPGVMRRDDIFLAGDSRTSTARWVAALGNYVGNFVAPLFGIPANGKLVFLRYGEFYRIETGRISEAVILLDLVDLMRQVGRMPLPAMLGSEILFPAPATHDGVLPQAPDRTTPSAELVEAMLRDLHAYDPETFASANQTGRDGYWHRDMLWYGPAGIGSSFTYEGFDRDHRVAFLRAFPDRRGGNHFARFGDGDYVCSGGWPSMTATHRASYLGVPATDRAIEMRVMDFWRVAGEKIAENWVLIDMPHLFRQLDVDLFERCRAARAA